MEDPSSSSIVSGISALVQDRWSGIVRISPMRCARHLRAQLLIGTLRYAATSTVNLIAGSFEKGRWT
jgi:hypothetical protein